MRNYSYRATSSDWTKLYDASVTGDFNGFIQSVNGFPASIIVSATTPTPSDVGVLIDDDPTNITIRASDSENLYARIPNNGNASVLSMLTMPWLIVGGASPVGSAPTANPVGVSGIDDSGLKRSLLTDTSGRLQPGDLPVLTNTGTIGSISDGATLAIPTGYKTAEAWLTTGNLSASVVIFFSFDGGSTYPAQGTAKRLDTASAVNGLVIAGTNVVGKAIRATIPVGATHARVGVSAYTSGSSDAVIALTGAAHTIQVTADAVLGSSTARAGFMAAPGVWTRESTTPVNATLSITGAAKTTFNTSSGTALNTSTSYGDKFAAAAGADVAGTLVIDASPDSGTTWYPVTSIALAQVGVSGNFGAYLETPICEATMRARLVNGVTNQARAYLTTRMLG